MNMEEFNNANDDAKFKKKNRANFKYCIVPKCISTSIKCPDKLFISLPKNPKLRNQWQKAMKRDIFLGPKSSKYVCEDHFNLEKDMENYQYYKIMGKGNVNVKMKPGILPHIFDCQKSDILKPTKSRITYEHRKRRQYVDEIVKTSENDNMQEIEDFKLPIDAQAIDMETGAKDLDKCIQVNLKAKNKSRSTQCNFRTKKIQKKELKSEAVKISESSDCPSSTSSSFKILSDESTNSNMLVESWNSKENVKKRAMHVIERNPKLYLGIPPQSMFIVDLICSGCQLSKMDVYVTLKKLKFDYPYTVLADDFCISTTKICTIIQNTLPKLSSYFKTFIQWKSLTETQNCLPIPFRYRFKKVQCIIDCFETSIQKPSDPILQALTWSEYKKGNTMKYLIACTPDGLISYISNGFGGRTTDKMIVEECGFLSLLDDGAHVMADRGFKHIDEMLGRQNNTLVRPPSVSANKKNTKEEVKHAKRVASLRIHVERVISRIREFKLLGPHTCVNVNLIKYLDDLVIVACGIINIQDYLIK